MKKIIVPIFVIMILFLGIELVLRLTMGNMNIAPIQIHPGDGRCVGLTPGSSVTYTGWFWRVDPVQHGANQYGYRGFPYDRQPPAGTFRIAVLGDSFVYGQGVGADCTMPVFMESNLADRKVPVQVLNFGIPGINLAESIAQYEFFAKNWQPHQVLLVISRNDLAEPLCDLFESRIHGWILKKVYLYRSLYVLHNIFFQEKPTQMTLRQNQNRILFFLGELNETVRRSGAQLVVVMLSCPANGSALNRAVKEMGIPILNPGERWWMDRVEVIQGEGHFTCLGNRVAAHIISQWLIHNKLLPFKKVMGKKNFAFSRSVS